MKVGNLKLSISISILLLMIIINKGQSQTSNLYMAREVKKAYINKSRSTTGMPGEEYWQNKAIYNIDVEVIPTTREVRGSEQILYINNSPDYLKTIVIRLYQDLYKKGNARGKTIDPDDLTDGVKITKLIVGEKEFTQEEIDRQSRTATNMTIRLPEVLLTGDTISISMDWSFIIPSKTHIRMGAYDETSFFIGYWYPQIAVYDDISDWDMYDYTGIQEFYNDFNDYNVKITAPHNFITWATGELKNPEKVFKPKFLERYNKSLLSDKITKIITSNDLKDSITITNDSLVRWEYEAKNVTDFAFAMSDHYIWDATSLEVAKDTNLIVEKHPKININTDTSIEIKNDTSIAINNDTILVAENDTSLIVNDSVLTVTDKPRRVRVSAVYNQGARGYNTVAKVGRKSIKLYSEKIIGVPFPFSNMTIFEGNRGMEFPMIINQGAHANQIETNHVTAHEILHTYFPFLVGMNEKKYAWMDEGLTTMLTTEAQKNIEPFHNSEANHIFYYSYSSGWEDEVPLMYLSILLNESSYNIQAYTRSCAAFHILSNMVGEDIFRKVIVEFINRWRGKHPIPYDLFFTFNDVVGQDLTWFWKPWFFDPAYPDISIKNIETNGNINKITIEKVGEIPVPVDLSITFDDNSKENHYESAIIWKDGKTELVIERSFKKKIKKIELNTEIIPDINSWNNTFIIK